MSSFFFFASYCLGECGTKGLEGALAASLLGGGNHLIFFPLITMCQEIKGFFGVCFIMIKSCFFTLQQMFSTFLWTVEHLIELQWADALPAEGRMGSWIRPLCQDGPFLGETALVPTATTLSSAFPWSGS